MAKSKYATLDELDHDDPLLCWLVGEAATGKSTLAAAFAAHHETALLIPSDGRLQVYRTAKDLMDFTIYPVPPNPDDWSNPDVIFSEIAEAVAALSPGCIIFDSLSPVFRELISEAQRIANMSADARKAEIGNSNKTAAYQQKALFMELVGLIANYARSTLWISHEFVGRDRNAKEVVKTTVTDQEALKFTRNVNLKLRTLIRNGVYCVEIIWARDMPSLNGTIIEDKVGSHRETWAKIATMLRGTRRVTFWNRSSFANADEAIALANELTYEAPDGGELPVFNDLRHVQNTYKQVRAAVIEKGGNAKVMAQEWKNECQRRKEALERGEDPSTS